MVKSKETVADSLDARLARRSSLREAYAALENQRKVLAALDEASRWLALEDDAHVRATSLAEEMAKAIVATCLTIWRLSGGGPLTLPEDAIS